MNKLLSNEEIAEAIGWSLPLNPGHPKYAGWLLPDGTTMPDTPNFYNNLDACFTWIVPWLKEMYGVDNISFYSRMDGNDCGDILCTLEYIQEDVDCIKQGIDKSPSLAFVKAFSQVVNKDGGHE